MDGGMVLILGALGALLVLGLLVEYRVLRHGRTQATGYDPAPPYAVPAGRAHAATASSGASPQRGERRRHHPRPTPAAPPPGQWDGNVGDNAEYIYNTSGDAADAYQGLGRYGDFDMLYDPYDGGPSYEGPDTPW